MRDVDLFQLALGLQSPWYVESAEFDEEAGQLGLRLDFHAGGTFAWPEC